MTVKDRLQERADGVDQFYGSSDEALDREAAAEIERLTAENEAIRKDRDDLLQQALGVEAERDIARMENERLRAALVKACDIALGTELTRQAVERIGELRSVTQQNTLRSKDAD